MFLIMGIQRRKKGNEPLGLNPTAQSRLVTYPFVWTRSTVDYSSNSLVHKSRRISPQNGTYHLIIADIITFDWSTLTYNSFFI